MDANSSNWVHLVIRWTLDWHFLIAVATAVRLLRKR